MSIVRVMLEAALRGSVLYSSSQNDGYKVQLYGAVRKKGRVIEKKSMVDWNSDSSDESVLYC